MYRAAVLNAVIAWTGHLSGMLQTAAARDAHVPTHMHLMRACTCTIAVHI
ncbi:MAG TPA: hypothetical protein VFG00_04665 [Acidothermaceae bacterium]|nr:hypothetical protein [Acidothermaceae bacterium]